MAIKRQLRQLLRPLLRRLPVVGARWDPVGRRRWLLAKMPRGSTGAEIGVWKGDLSARILAVVRPKRLYLIDPWRKAERDTVRFMDTQSAGDQTYMDSVHDSVVNRFNAAISRGVVVVHRARSQDAATKIPTDSLDWAYIDGDHTYEAVLADLHAYADKVRPGGFLAGDDYAQGGRYRGGVKRAVDEFVGSGEYRLVLIRARQFILERKSG